METILVRYSEIALKKGNRRFFENALVNNIRKKLPGIAVRKEFGRIYLAVERVDEAVKRTLTEIPGLSSFSIVLTCEKTPEAITAEWMRIIENGVLSKETASFKFDTDRIDKSFPIHSDEFSRILGDAALRKFPELTGRVRMKNPDITLHTEIRNRGVYLFTDRVHGIGGLPVGVSGKGLSLLSGGIDSPVASFLCMKRGMTVDFVYFHSYPFTPDETKDKVRRIAERLASFGNGARLHVVNFTEIQKSIRKNTKLDYLTILIRRAMMEISGRIAQTEGYDTLVTGEALSQVASQTIQSLACTDAAAGILVLRPLITFDKEETVTLARKIGTFELSNLPFEDCCTVFVPKNPVTKPRLKFIIGEESFWHDEALVVQAVETKEVIAV